MARVCVLGLGLGYGLSLYLSKLEHEVLGVDVDRSAFEQPRIDDETKQALAKWHDTVTFVDRYAPLANFNPDFVLVFVSTPLKGGRLSMFNVLSALSAAWARAGATPEYGILSTLPVGGMKQVRESFPKMTATYCPPMIKKARFLSTFRDPPSGWQLFGGSPSLALRRLFKEAQDGGVKQIVAAPETIEWAKLLTNAVLATKVTLANAIGRELGEMGTDVCRIVNADPRVGEGYFTPGGPASGPCLPRDMTELEAATLGTLHKLLAAVNDANGTYAMVRETA